MPPPLGSLLSSLPFILPCLAPLLMARLLHHLISRQPRKAILVSPRAEKGNCSRMMSGTKHGRAWRETCWG